MPLSYGGRNAPFVVIVKRFSGILHVIFFGARRKWHNINVNNCRRQLIALKSFSRKKKSIR
jgi:hypothetical protein